MPEFERLELERKLCESAARLERLLFIQRKKRAEYDRCVADADQEWMVGENLRTRLKAFRVTP